MANFNVLECVQDLREAGFTQDQAEAQAKHIEKAKADLETHLATKQDIEQLRSDTKQDIELLRKDIEQLRSDTKQDIEQLRSDTKKDIELLRKDIEQLRSDTKKDLQNLENKLLWKQTLAMAALLGIAKILNMLPSYLGN